MIYQCDLCARHCTRIHRFVAYGLEGQACDDCADYDWAAYDEAPDPLLYPEDECDGHRDAAMSGSAALEPGGAPAHPGRGEKDGE